MALELIDLNPACGTPNPAGTTRSVYVVCSCDVDTFPDRLAADGAGAGVTLDGDITLLALKKFKKFEILADTGEVKRTKVGAPGSGAFKSMYACKVRGSGPGEIEWLEGMVAADECLIVLVEDNLGDVHCVGTVKNPAKVETAEATTGAGPEGERAITMEISSTGGVSASFYTGAIDVDDTV